MNLFRAFGFVFLALGVLGVFLPLLPATPFVLLAAACFARSSERWHQWMLANQTFGPMIRNWEKHRCITCRIKLVAIVSMAVAGGYSIAFAVESATARVAGGLFLALGFVTVSVIRTCDRAS